MADNDNERIQELYDVYCPSTGDFDHRSWDVLPDTERAAFSEWLKEMAEKVVSS